MSDAPSVQPSSGEQKFTAEITEKKPGEIRLVIRDESGQVIDVQAKHVSKKITNPYLRRLNNILTSFRWKKIYLPTGKKVLVSRGDLFVQRHKSHADSASTKLFFEQNKLIGKMGQAGYTFEKTEYILTTVKKSLPQWERDRKKAEQYIEVGEKFIQVGENLVSIGQEVVTVKYLPGADSKSQEIVLTLKHLGDGSFKNVILEVLMLKGKAFAKATPRTLGQGDDNIAQEEYERLKPYQGCPHIIQGYCIGGVHYTEYMNKGSLVDNKELCKDNQKTRLQLMSDICKGVKDVHHHKKVHNDLAPSNILVKQVWRDGKPVFIAKVADFDLEREEGTRETQVAGRFKSPEKARTLGWNESYTHKQADDIWSLGITLYYMKYGEFPNFQKVEGGAVNASLLDEYLKTEPSKGTEEHIIWRALQKDSTKRPTIDELLKMVEECQARLPPETPK